LEDAIIYIANLLRQYWGANSPPEKGPLHEIDTWGAGLIEAYGAGMLSAVPSMLREVSGSMAAGITGGFGAIGGASVPQISGVAGGGTPVTLVFEDGAFTGAFPGVEDADGVQDAMERALDELVRRGTTLGV